MACNEARQAITNAQVFFIDIYSISSKKSKERTTRYFQAQDICEKFHKAIATSEFRCNTIKPERGHSCPQQLPSTPMLDLSRHARHLGIAADRNVHAPVLVERCIVPP